MVEFDRLVEIMRVLRSPEGCPWDIKQTHESLKPYLIEEAYEVIDAIDKGDSQKLKEELGDLLLHIVFHARIAAEEGEFDIDDVSETISEKLIQRHPHVFGEDARRISAEEVLANWEHIKATTSNDDNYYVLDGLPLSMPALLKAYRIQEKVDRFGFDWSNAVDILEKFEEEKSELEEAIQSGDTKRIEDELGDLLFTVVNLSRHLKVVPEAALNSTCDKFRNRFKLMEDMIRADGLELGGLDIEQLDEYWEKAKNKIG